MKPNILFILLLLATYVLAPVLDAVACDDCKDVISLYTEQEVLSNEVSHSDSTAQTTASEESGPSDSGMEKDLCPLCSNAASGMKSHKYTAPFLTVHVVSMPKLLAILDPSYPINKPPQN